MDISLVNEFLDRDFALRYSQYYSSLLINYSEKLQYKSKIINKQTELYKIFKSIPHLDYVIELTSSEMPIDYITKNIKEKTDIIPNINQIDKNNNPQCNTNFERITKSELLGFFAEVDLSLINELKSNGFEKYEFSKGKVITITPEDLEGKKVVFMCPENIETEYKNLKTLTKEQLIDVIDPNHEFEIFDSLEENIEKLLNTKNDLFKFVFYHECGHSAFCEINKKISKKYNSPIIHEKQANYYASLVLEGRYDLLIEIINNRIGKEYSNPLLKSHEYTRGIIKFEEEEKKLYE